MIFGTTDEDDDDGLRYNDDDDDDDDDIRYNDDDDDLRYNDVWRRGEKNHSGENCVPSQTDQAKSEISSLSTFKQATILDLLNLFLKKVLFTN